MRWSKRKARVESMFSDTVKGRVELKSSRYRNSHDTIGRGYITFDKKEIWNMCTLSFLPIEAEKIRIIVEKDNITASQAQKTVLTPKVLSAKKCFTVLWMSFVITR